MVNDPANNYNAYKIKQICATSVYQLNVNLLKIGDEFIYDSHPMITYSDGLFFIH